MEFKKSKQALKERGYDVVDFRVEDDEARFAYVAEALAHGLGVIIGDEPSERKVTVVVFNSRKTHHTVTYGSNYHVDLKRLPPNARQVAKCGEVRHFLS